MIAVRILKRIRGNNEKYYMVKINREIYVKVKSKQKWKNKSEKYSGISEKYSLKVKSILKSEKY